MGGEGVPPIPSPELAAVKKFWTLDSLLLFLLRCDTFFFQVRLCSVRVEPK